MSDPFLAPTSLAEALDLLAKDSDRVVLAGGTDLWPQWNATGKKPQRVLSLHRLVELNQIVAEDGALKVGALCSHATIGSNTLVRRHAPALAAAAQTIGAAQIQNRGTLGGNVINASPAADLPPPLLAADATVQLASHRGPREVPIANFFREYKVIDRALDELLIAIKVPCLPTGTREFFRKVGTRRAQAISKVVGASRLAVDNEGVIRHAALAFGSVAAIPLRLLPLERWLVDKELSAVLQEAGPRASACVEPIDDLRSSAPYRKHVVAQLVTSWLEQLLPGEHRPQ